MDIERQYKERKFWDKFAKKYDFFMRNLKSTYNLLLNYIRQDLNTNQIALEIAMGTGQIALNIAPNVKKIFGCDISPEMINIAKKKAGEISIENCDLSVQDAYNLNYESDFFDIVIACNVLHVMIHPEQALLSIHRVLKKDGILIAPTYCHGNSFISRIISSIMSLAGFKAYNKWSLLSFKELIEYYNYKIIKSHIIKDKIPLLYIAAKKL